MKNTFYPQFVFGIVLIMLSNHLFGQATKQALILINSRPVLAEVDSNRTVVKIIKDEYIIAPGYDFSPQAVILPSTTPQKVNGEVNLVDSKKFIAPKPSTDFPAKNLSSRFIVFDRKFAILTDESILDLEKVAIELKNNDKFVIVRALSIYPDAPLTKNRLNAVKAYLKVQGIDSNRIVTEALRGEVSSDELKIIFAQ